MNTGITSLAKLPEMAEVYPFAGYEPLFSIIALVFFVAFIFKQIAMDKAFHEEMIDHTPEAIATPAE
ncbi:hypothetical protein V5F34_15280 [Xanthobacter autotrophicus]|jgi:hypothetical protein|uniref:Uncharacterized protein n=1 Tax=Xanthobacter autotrophicus TaxID=280 RepID=A0A6C1KU75_XANAU|nr:hypothetical protein [Xanthobacter autotrophicus]TLX42613.1 hypothetical protein FBQ73_13310 [Xanthobacter autotrophicus]